MGTGTFDEEASVVNLDVGAWGQVMVDVLSYAAEADHVAIPFTPSN